MKRKNLFTTLAAITLSALLGGTPANAQTHTWTGSGDGVSWSQLSNWSTTTGVVPNSASHTVLISNDPAVDLDMNATVGELTLVNATLNITDSSARRVLTITGSSASGELTIDPNSVMEVRQYGEVQLVSLETHKIGGILDLDYTSATITDFPLLKINDDVTFGPYDPSGTPVYGSIRGTTSLAAIEIVDTKMLRNQVTIRGRMVLRPASGTATLKNEGVVHADDGGVLLLESGLILDDIASVGGVERWAATGPGAVLEFREGATGAGMLDADFLLNGDCATLTFWETLETNGLFDYVVGAVDVDTNNNVCFIWDFDDDVDQICDNQDNCS